MPSSRNGRYVAIGLMLFALFFGAGNLIFPAAMGQSAGVNIGWALLGFCITGVGLPLLGVIAVAFSGTRDAQSLASRVHPVYGVIYTVMSYLAIGPCFAVPRTGTVSFEIAVRPFLSAETAGVALPIFLAVFFGIVYWFASSPSKLVDRIGKVLTPALVLTLIIFIVQSFITPMGDPQEPTVAYATPAEAAVQGVLDGYNTLDGLVSLIFGTLVVATVREAGFKNAREISRQVYKSGLLAGCMLGLICGENRCGKRDGDRYAGHGSADFGFERPAFLRTRRGAFVGGDGASRVSHDLDRTHYLLRGLLSETDRQVHVLCLGDDLYDRILSDRAFRFEDDHHVDDSDSDVPLSLVHDAHCPGVPQQSF